MLESGSAEGLDGQAVATGCLRWAFGPDVAARGPDLAGRLLGISVGGDCVVVCNAVQSHCCPSSRRKCICFLLERGPPTFVPRIGHAVVVGVFALRYVSLSGYNGRRQRVAE